VTSDRWSDAMRDALALVSLFLEAGPDGLPDQGEYEAILRNGDPLAIAASAALAFAGCLATLEEQGVIRNASSMLRDLQQMYAEGIPGA